MKRGLLGWLWPGGVLLGVAVLPAVATGWWHPRSPWRGGVEAVGVEGGAVAVAEGEVDVATAAGWGSAVLWVDARAESAFLSGHVPGAVWLNEDVWEQRVFDVLAAWPASGRVVVYCGGEACGVSRAVAERLREEAGSDGVYALRGGWEAWRKRQIVEAADTRRGELFVTREGER